MDKTESDEALKDKTSAAEYVLQATIEWVPRVDNRISILLGVLVAMIGTILVVAPPIDKWSDAAIITSMATGASLIVAAFGMFKATFPVTKGPTDSRIFFGSVGKRKAADYAAGFLAQSKSDYLDDLLAQIHRNAEIVSAKFKHIKIAFISTVVAVPLWAATLILFDVEV